MKSGHVDGHEIEVGMELDGQGRRVYIDGIDFTDYLLGTTILPVLEDGHGMRVAMSDQRVLHRVEHAIQSGSLKIQSRE